MKSDKTTAPAARAGAAEPEIEETNPGYGEKGGFRKVTLTVPQWAYRVLVQESARRKIAGEPKQLLSDLVREAIFEYLNKLREQSI